MQTFLPFPSFSASAAALDNKRLNKQIVEAKQILLANLCGPWQRFVNNTWVSEKDTIFALECPRRKTPWYNHPATKIWRGHERALCLYAIDCCIEALARGINASLTDFFINHAQTLADTGKPSVIGHEPFHASHRSNLKRKDPIYYAAFTEPTNLPYIWTL